MRPVAWSTSYLLRPPLGISMVTSKSTGALLLVRRSDGWPVPVGRPAPAPRVSAAGGPAQVSTAQLTAGRTGEPAEDSDTRPARRHTQRKPGSADTRTGPPAADTSLMHRDGDADVRGAPPALQGNRGRAPVGIGRRIGHSLRLPGRGARRTIAVLIVLAVA